MFLVSLHSQSYGSHETIPQVSDCDMYNLYQCLTHVVSHFSLYV